MTTILLVLFVVTQFIWLLSMPGAASNGANYSPWLAWFGCLFLGLAVFAGGWFGR